ncbi:MAG TPA: c-type cytochrome [Ignavibacteria bacterium]|nr:c-type cytochrome [Ignavibacteria bacterium]
MNKYIAILSLFVIALFMISLTSKTAVTGSDIKDNSDSLDAAKQKYVDEIMITISGKENMPSDSVFKNLQMLKEMPADKLLGLMNFGFSKALGVGCDHCHNVQDFASDEIPAKQISREMMNMSGQIREMLKNIKEIKSEKPSVTCATCHRGAIIPATKLN